MVANPNLVKKQGISKEDVKKINFLHRLDDVIQEEMQMTDSSEIELLRFMEDNWHEVQFKLQDLWGFPCNKARHPSWRLPHCLCPKMDNDDYEEHMWINENCPLHSSRK